MYFVHMGVEVGAFMVLPVFAAAPSVSAIGRFDSVAGVAAVSRCGVL